jgi:hypothetical protein
MDAFLDMQRKRRAWTRKIDKAKASHWKQFLDEAGEGKLWKAATYMKPREVWGCIPALQAEATQLTDNEDKARAFRCSARETSKSRVEQQHAELVKKRWLTVESFTAFKLRL